MDTVDAPGVMVPPHRRSFGRRTRPGATMAASRPTRSGDGTGFSATETGSGCSGPVAPAGTEADDEVVFSPAIDGVIDRILGWETPGLIGGAIDSLTASVSQFMASDAGSSDSSDGGGDGGGGD
jgi:hypothetical protein